MSREEKANLFRERLATALKMDLNDHWRPKVTVQSRGHLADKLIELAEEYNVPIVQDAELANDMKFLEIGSSLPTELFPPVAEILAHIYLISQKAKDEGLASDQTE